MKENRYGTVELKLSSCLNCLVCSDRCVISRLIYRRLVFEVEVMVSRGLCRGCGLRD